MHELAENAWSAGHRALGREFGFLDGWWKAGLIAAALSAQILFIIFLLEPGGTDRYHAPWRTLRLSGYALCLMAPYLLLHAFDRWVYRHQRNRWRVSNLLLSRAVLIGAVVISTYFYNATVINQVVPSLGDGLAFALRYGLPLVLLLVPLAAFLEVGLARSAPSAPVADEPSLTILGRNADDRFDIAPGHFVYAEALQNYVTVVVRKAGAPDKRIVRATLGEIAGQLPGAIRIHRSYLVNPRYLVRIDGNRRKRSAVVQYLERQLPVSPNFVDSR